MSVLPFDQQSVAACPLPATDIRESLSRSDQQIFLGGRCIVSDFRQSEEWSQEQSLFGESVWSTVCRLGEVPELVSDEHGGVVALEDDQRVRPRPQ